jgi:hypothetical protein
LAVYRHGQKTGLANNTKHFTEAVGKRTALRIATPVEFFRILSSLLR